MREVRHVAVSHRPDQPQECHQRLETGDARDKALVSAVGQARGMVAPVDSGRSQGMA